ncbi:MAG: hypothetical protein WC842_01800 [Candidatus Paceibacterota bacterium]|jgi:thymidylate kinase
MKKGIYILVECPSGSGKSSRAMDIFKLLKEKGIPAIFNSQPTKKNPFGFVIRELIERRNSSDELLFLFEKKIDELWRILKDRLHSTDDLTLVERFIGSLGVVPDLLRGNRSNEISERVRQSIFCADGLFDLIETILPALERGECVVQDRERTSSLTYGSAHGVPFLENLKIHQLIIGEFYRKPDIFFYIDTSAETCVEHLAKSGKVLDIYEKKESLVKTIDEYGAMLSYFNENPEIGYTNIFCINGEQDEKKVFNDMIDVLKFFNVI